MAILSRKADYALVILSHLHRHPDGGCAREIADGYKLNRGFVANILKELCRKGFVVGHRGVRGGYALALPAESVNLADLLESLDEDMRLAQCNHGEDHEEVCALEGSCPIRSPIGEVHQRIKEVLQSLTLAELFQHPLPELVDTLQPTLTVM